jgi:hypothetical protein
MLTPPVIIDSPGVPIIGIYLLHGYLSALPKDHIKVLQGYYTKHTKSGMIPRVP